MMKYFLLLILFIHTSAQAKVVFLSSLGDVKQTLKVEKHFRKKMEGYNGQMLVVAQATQWELYKALTDKEVESVFWLSHGVSVKNSTTEAGSFITPKIIDYRGDNIAPVFSLAGKHLKFLAVIGCDSEKILEHYGLNEELRNNSYISPSAKVSATHQITKAVKAMDKITINGAEVSHSVDYQGSIRVLRKLNHDLDFAHQRSLRVYAGNVLVGLIPALSHGKMAEASFLVPVNADLKIKLESGQNQFDPTLGEMGDIHIESLDIAYDWKLFADKNGKPFGVVQRVFRPTPM